MYFLRQGNQLNVHVPKMWLTSSVFSAFKVISAWKLSILWRWASSGVLGHVLQKYFKKLGDLAYFGGNWVKFSFCPIFMQIWQSQVVASSRGSFCMLDEASGVGVKTDYFQVYEMNQKAFSKKKFYRQNWKLLDMQRQMQRYSVWHLTWLLCLVTFSN